MTAAIRNRDIERAVRAFLRGGGQLRRVVVDMAASQIIIVAGEQDPPEQPQSFDTVVFASETR